MIVRLRLFLSSYAPLFAIGAIRFEGVALRVSLGAIAVAGAVSLALLVRTSARRLTPRRVTPTSVEDMGAEVSAYIATYLLPFVAVERPDALDLVAYGLVLVVLAVVFVNSDLLGVNPLLYLAGYRAYAVGGTRLDRAGTARPAVMISRNQPSPNEEIEIADLADGVAVALRPKQGTE